MTTIAKGTYQTQQDIVHEHLLHYGSITSMEAFSLYKITRLSAIIFSLREEGLKIASERPPKGNYVEYKIVKKVSHK